MKAAIAGIVRAFDKGVRRVPIQAQATLDVTGRMLLGTDISAVCATLDALPIDVIGLNCSTGPVAHARPDPLSGRELALLRERHPERGAAADGAAAARRSIPRRRTRWRRELRAFVADFGVNAIGGCCGTTPEHIAAFRAVLDALAARGHAARARSPSRCSSRRRR